MCLNIVLFKPKKLRQLQRCRLEWKFCFYIRNRRNNTPVRKRTPWDHEDQRTRFGPLSSHGFPGSLFSLIKMPLVLSDYQLMLVFENLRLVKWWRWCCFERCGITLFPSFVSPSYKRRKVSHRCRRKRIVLSRDAGGQWSNEFDLERYKLVTVV